MLYSIIFNLYNLFNKPQIIDFKYLDNPISVSVEKIEEDKKEYQAYLKKLEEYKKLHYFNGEEDKVIAKKLNRYLNSTLESKGEYIVKYSLSVGIDPYLVTAVMLQETGCAWTCSNLTRTCYNVGGNKGTPSCNGSSYRKFSSINEGIRFAIDKLNSYYKKGLKTPQQINPYYASDKTWYVKINNYMNKLKK